MEKALVCKYGTISWETKHILKFDVAPVELTIEDIDEFIDCYEHALTQVNGKFVSLVDGSHGKWISTSVRIHMGKRFNELERKYAERQHKTFVVVPNGMVKMMIQGINLVTKPIVPQEFFSSFEGAESAAYKAVANW